MRVWAVQIQTPAKNFRKFTHQHTEHAMALWPTGSALTSLESKAVPRLQPALLSGYQWQEQCCLIICISNLHRSKVFPQFSLWKVSWVYSAVNVGMKRFLQMASLACLQSLVTQESGNPCCICASLGWREAIEDFLVESNSIFQTFQFREFRERNVKGMWKARETCWNVLNFCEAFNPRLTLQELCKSFHCRCHNQEGTLEPGLGKTIVKWCKMHNQP